MLPTPYVCRRGGGGYPVDSDHMSISIISASSEIMGGTPVFSGTHV